MDDQDIIREFLIESSENLARLDQEMVALEQRPGDLDLLGSIFRTIHTVKGTCGFFGFTRLESLAHAAENLLSQLRSGERALDGPLTRLILEAVDAIKRILASIESAGSEGEVFEGDLVERLLSAVRYEAAAGPVASPPPIVHAPAVPVAPAAAVDEKSAPETSVPNAPQKPPIADTTLRIDIGILDRLMNLVGELVLTRNQVLQFNAGTEDAVLNAISQRLNLITSELQEGVMKTRMQPIGVVWKKLPRVVRDLAKALNKEIHLEMDGAETELDRTIIESIKDPLTHIVRNSCDHGIEAPEERLRRGKPASGRLALRAFHEGGQVNIEIADDGGGIDRQRIKAKAIERGLISAEQAQRMPDREALSILFLPGFSTAQQVTSISGRGVGMDVVRTHIQRIGGTVDLVSEAGRGTTVRIRIPLTLAIIPGLLVRAGGEQFIIPQVSLHELIRLEADAARAGVEHIHNTPVLRRRNRLLPLVDLSRTLGLTARAPADEVSVVVLQMDNSRFGLVVDEIGDTQEIVVKPLGYQLKGLNCYAGATILGDGKIALILDIAGIASRSGVAVAADSARETAPEAAVQTDDEQTSVLVFRAGEFARLAIPLGRVVRLEEFARTSVERAAGREVIQYRGRMLPLVSLADVFGTVRDTSQEIVHTIVYREGNVDLGLVVDEIVDIIEDRVTSRYAADRPGLLGSAVVGGMVTDFLDLEAVTAWAALGPEESLIRLNAALGSEDRSRALSEVLR